MLTPFTDTPVACAVRSLRTEAGYTQEQLAAHAGIARPTVTKIERGTDIPNPWTIHCLILALQPRVTDVTPLARLTPWGAFYTGDADDSAVVSARVVATDALRRAERAESEAVSLRAQIAALRVPQRDLRISTPAPANDDDTPLTDIELTRLRRTIAELRAEEYERHAVAICAALDCVERIDRELRAATGREWKRGRDMGPYRRQGVKVEAA